MRLHTDTPVWSPADAENLKAFLASQTGQRLLDKLLYERPDFAAFTDPNRRLIESGVLEGYERAIHVLSRSTIHNPEN